MAEPSQSDEAAARAVQKRYEGLMTVRNKAVKGKGAWYWAHLEPLLVHNNDKTAVKLRCSLCHAVFSASNPSRTASEHLKRGTCPNFSSVENPSAVQSVVPEVAVAETSSSSHRMQNPNHRKRSSSSAAVTGGGVGGSSGGYISPPPTFHHVTPLSIIDPSRFCTGDVSYAQQVSAVNAPVSISGGAGGCGPCSIPPHHQQQHLVLSGGKEDLGALAMLEDSVKKLKSPKTSPGSSLSKAQVGAAFDLLADWVFQSCGSVSLSSLEHPKFRAFLYQVGLPTIPRQELTGSRLESRYNEAKKESEERIREALFFQVSSNGWKNHKNGWEEILVNLSVNLPNGTSVFRKAVFVTGCVPSSYAEEVLSGTINGICGNAVHQCVGIVSDKFRTTALRNLENQHPWMVNLSCQLQGLNSLIKDFSMELLLFKKVTENCLKVANFANNNPRIRCSFNKYQLQECGQSGLIRISSKGSDKDFGHVFTMLEDILNSARSLHLVVSDESFKMVSMEDPIAKEVADMIKDMGFWNELEAVHSLVKLVKEMAQEIEIERMLIGQCLPLWDSLRSKVKEWCSKYHIVETPLEKVIDRRFNKNYHPAWAAAFILDPLYLIRDTSGRYLPPFKCLTSDQEKDVDKLITRLVSRDEAHIVLMELMKWRSEGLDQVYARAVQMKDRDPVSGKMKVANPQSSRLIWETYLTEFKALGKVAVRLIFLHATSCGFKCNFPLSKWGLSHHGKRVGMERAQKMIFIAAHSKLEKQDFSNGDDDRDVEMFGLANGEDDLLVNEVFIDSSPV